MACCKTDSMIGHMSPKHVMEATDIWNLDNARKNRTCANMNGRIEQEMDISRRMLSASVSVVS